MDQEVTASYKADKYALKATVNPAGKVQSEPQLTCLHRIGVLDCMHTTRAMVSGTQHAIRLHPCFQADRN